MNARETHLLKEQDKRDALQRKAGYNKTYFDKHPDKKERCLRYFDELKVARVCSALKKHAEDLKDDPERLSTEFILDMSKLKKQRFCTLHRTACISDDEGYAGCGDLVDDCHWVDEKR